MPKKLLLIFTRNPELGKVKSRLAQGVGEENALEIYKTLLTHTRDIASQIECTRRVGYSVKVRKNDLWDNALFDKFAQEGEDLGERMSNAFKKGFKEGYEQIIIVGSDLFDLKTSHIEKAFKSLDTKDTVIGPAKDGGYYLLGMTQYIPTVFHHKQWGTETVYKDTITDLEKYTVHTLETLNDIDYASDLEPYPEFAHYLL